MILSPSTAAGRRLGASARTAVPWAGETNLECAVETDREKADRQETERKEEGARHERERKEEHERYEEERKDQHERDEQERLDN